MTVTLKSNDLKKKEEKKEKTNNEKKKRKIGKKISKRFRTSRRVFRLYRVMVAQDAAVSLS